jgi:hypothetical protein
MHFLFDLIISGYFRLVMMVYDLIANTKINYLTAPEFIISDIRKFKLNRWFHLLPSSILCIVFTLKILPLISSEIEHKLEMNSPWISLYILGNLFMISIMNGWIIEKYLEKTDRQYRALKSN